MPRLHSGKFVILGGASQIGSHIAERLMAAGAREIVLFDNLSLGSIEPLRPLLGDGRCRFVRGDVLRVEELFDVFADADGVFATAGMMPSTINEQPGTSIDVNVRGFQNALEACRYRGVAKLVFSSSGGVCGVPAHGPMDEETPFRWQDAPPASIIYGASKIMCEALARLYEARYGIEFVALRYTSVYGERQHGRAVMGGHLARTCERVRAGLAPIIDGDGVQVQDYIHAGDVARANLMAMESAVTGESINIVSGVDTSQRRLVEIVCQACGTFPAPEYRPLVVDRWPPRTALGFSRAKAERLLGWEPEVSIEEGVDRVLGWIDREAAHAP